MTVIELPGQKLWVHSPIRPTDELVDDLNELGDVEAIIAPNLFHHLNVQAFSYRFPNAVVYGVPGLHKKQKDLNFENLFDKRSNWSPSIEAKIVQGMPILKEVVFFHPDSKTLIVTDLLFNLQKNTGLSKWILKLDGIDGKLAFSKLSKLAIKDKVAFKKSLTDILDWDFEQIIMAHGTMVTSQARRDFEDVLFNV